MYNYYIAYDAIISHIGDIIFLLLRLTLKLFFIYHRHGDIAYDIDP